MKTFNQTYIIKAPLTKVWNALVDPEEIDNWGAGEAKMDENVGTEFTLWNGDIYGKNLEVEKNKKLIQEWYAGDWAIPSKVTINLSEKNGKTTVELTHEDVPDSEAKELEDGWKSSYFGPLKEYVEKFA